MNKYKKNDKRGTEGNCSFLHRFLEIYSGGNVR